MYGRIGAAVARSRHDPAELTRNARRTFLAGFEAQIRAGSSDLPEAEIRRRAGELRTAHMLQLALKSSLARSIRRTAGPTKPTAREVRDANARPPQGA